MHRFSIMICLFFSIAYMHGAIAAADILYFGEDNFVEGTIIEETDSEIVLQMDTGSIAFPRNTIQRLVRGAAPGVQPKAEITIEDLFAQYRQYDSWRKRVRKLAKQRQALNDRCHYLKTRYQQNLLLMRDREDDYLEVKARKDTIASGRISVEMQSYRAKIEDDLQRLRESIGKRYNIDRTIQALVAKLFAQQFELNKNFTAVQEVGINPGEEFYYEDLEKELRTILYDFSLYSLPIQKVEDGYIVGLVVNDVGESLFLYREDFPVFIISEECADRYAISGLLPVASDLGFLGLEGVDGIPATFDKIAYDEVVIEQPSFFITEEMPDPHIHGIIGKTSFIFQVLRLDEEKETIYVYQFNYKTK